MVERLLQRSRFDDTAETIQKRVSTFQTTTAKVLEDYEATGKVVRIDAQMNVEDVSVAFQDALKGAEIVLEPVDIVEGTMLDTDTELEDETKPN